MPKRLSLFLLLLVLFPMGIRAQTALVAIDGSRIWVEGDSNKSSWTVNAEQYIVRIELSDGAPSAALVTIPVKQMKGGKSIIMDRLMQKALKADEAPEIRFEMDKASAGAQENTWNLTGSLTIADSTRSVAFPLAQSLEGDGIRYTGSYGFLMTDFGIEPPSIIMNALRTRNDVVVYFDLLAAHEE